jgi:RimJ/RimL family protein N-acetyltransferase
LTPSLSNDRPITIDLIVQERLAMTGTPLPPPPPESREHQVAFRALAREDMDMLLRWLGDPDVASWYREGELTPENLEAKYGPVIDEREPVRGYIILIDDRPAGYIQAYVLGDHPNYLVQLDLEPDAVSTDLFIGDSVFRNHGWGAPVLRAFHRRIVFGEMGARIASIMPSSRNERAIAAYRKAGFTWSRVVRVHDPEQDQTDDEVIMLLSRTTFLEQDLG